MLCMNNRKWDVNNCAIEEITLFFSMDSFFFSFKKYVYGKESDHSTSLMFFCFFFTLTPPYEQRHKQ
jgi:hypothetical protein